MAGQTAEPGGGYDRHRARQRERAVSASAKGRDIGPIPAVADELRREACRGTFRRFCETYFPAAFSLAWSPDHLRVIEKIERVVLDGGRFAIAMPRGSGKSTLCECACLWATLYGHRSYVVVVGSDRDAATEMIDALKVELEANELLEADFPAVCYPIAKLERIPQRAGGQLCEGEPTRIGWTEHQLMLPSIPGADSYGAIIQARGLTGRLRGMKHKRADGTTVRPDLVLLDDPQTRESAYSPAQVAKREATIRGDVGGLAGPGKSTATLAAVTVVVRDDLADRLLDRQRSPDWKGERTKMIEKWPDREDLWAKYRELREDALREEREPTDADAFYRANRAEMDKGAVVAWEERKLPKEQSALQHAMNLLSDFKDAFFAEYQNEPLADDEADDDQLQPDELVKRLNHLDHRQAAPDTERITAMIDVQGKALFYVVTAWAKDFSGAVIDYGVYPDPNLRRFTLRELKTTLRHKAPKTGLEGAIYAGLEHLAGELLGREYPTKGGGAERISRLAVDAAWGQSTDVVFRWARETIHAANVIPSFGQYVGASSKPLNEAQRKPGDRTGYHWRIPGDRRRGIRRLIYDANAWKTFVAARLSSPMGEPGALSLFGGEPRRHELLAEHLTAEMKVRTQGRGREVDEWKLKVASRDNHWWDCLVGSAVCASVEGVQLASVSGDQPRRRKRVKLSELQDQRRAERGRA